MPEVSIAREALKELRKRMGRLRGPSGILIAGPMAEDPRAPASLEESWHLERLYGPAPKWTFQIVPVDELESEEPEAGEEIYLQSVEGIPVVILTSKRIERLHVDLIGDSIRIYDVDV